jgi:hypothetical protein
MLATSIVVCSAISLNKYLVYSGIISVIIRHNYATVLHRETCNTLPDESQDISPVMRYQGEVIKCPYAARGARR